MATIHDFTELRIFQQAEWLDEQIWALQDVAYDADRSTWWQITRSVASIADNIAEGFSRGSKGEYKTFLGYSRGSAGEVRAQLRRMKRRGYLPEDTADHLIDRCMRLERSIKTTIETVRDSSYPGMRHTPSKKLPDKLQEPPVPYLTDEDLVDTDLPF